MKRLSALVSLALAVMMISGALCAAHAADPGYQTANVVVISHTQPVNVRAGSGTEFQVVATAYPGSSYRYLGTTRQGWYVIEMDGGLVGCVSSNMAYLSYDRSDPTYSGTCSHRIGYVYISRPDGGYIDMHVQRDVSSDLLRHAYSGMYDCVAEYNGWYTIVCNGHMGYVQAHEVAFTENRVSTYTPSAVGIVWINTKSMVNVRRGNNQYTDLAMSVCPGASLLCLGTDPETGWYQVLLPDGTSGYISNNLVSLSPLGNG